MRIDKLLWFLRLAASRNLAQQWVQAGHIRLGGRRVEKPSTPVNCGDVLTLPLPGGVKLIEILALPGRRGPAPEAQSCYRVLDVTGQNALAAGHTITPEGTSLP